MAVLGSNGVGWNVSCGANSVDCGDWEGCAVDLRPVIESQLQEESVHSVNLPSRYKHTLSS
jgi:hypothetical protein